MNSKPIIIALGKIQKEEEEQNKPRSEGTLEANESADSHEQKKYQADKGIRRGQGDLWTRHFSMLIPVRQHEVWTNLGPQLSGTLFELTGDKFDFYFVAKGIDEESASPTKSPERTKEGSDEKSASDCVCLFSGGLDGFAGVNELAGRRRRPILVSHYINNLKPIQYDLVQALGAAFDHKFEHLQFRVGPRNIEEKTKRSFVTVENTQRSRSFLFLAMAAIVAFERKADELFICENGVLAINLPLTPSRLGSRSTRSTHPHTSSSPFRKSSLSCSAQRLRFATPFTSKPRKRLLKSSPRRS